MARFGRGFTGRRPRVGPTGFESQVLGTRFVDKAGGFTMTLSLPAALQVKTVLASRTGKLPATLILAGPSKAVQINKPLTTLFATLVLAANKTALVSKANRLIVTSSLSGAKTVLASRAGSLPLTLVLSGNKTALVLKAGAVIGTVGIRGIERVFTYSVAGVTYDYLGNIVGSVQTELFRSSDRLRLSRVTSDPVTGRYVFSPLPGDATLYWVDCFKSGSPDIFGRTDENLIVSQNQVQGPANSVNP